MTSSNFSQHEVEGVTDFLQSQPSSELAVNLAHIISNNAIKCENVSDAIDVILLHSSSIQSILNRKVITKNILFKYLHEKRVPLTTTVTKQFLVERCIEYWHTNHAHSSASSKVNYPSQGYPNTNQEIVEDPSNDRQKHFQIQEMSRAFAHWFFQNLNSSSITVNDFWSDVGCETIFYENKVSLQNEGQTGADEASSFLLSLISAYQLYFNLNDCDDGVQGRIDPHGLVLVLSCGTLHKAQQFVGTFESVFGLLRDPFSENNWKIKHIKLRLHNSSAIGSATPTLHNCESMGSFLCLKTGPEVQEID